VKIAHRSLWADWFAVPESDPVDDDYAAEVQQATGRGEREYRQAQQRLARAETRLARVRAQKATNARKKCAAELEASIAERRAELAELERIMTAPVAADKQIRLRTGLDDHLELGEYKAPRPRLIPPSPVMRTRQRAAGRSTAGKEDS
jgi:hypothetical protein